MGKFIDLKAFRDDESGAGLVWNLFWTVIFLICAGFVIDMSNAYRFKAVLRATADSAALASIQTYYEKRAYETFSGDTSGTAPDDRARNAAQGLARIIMKPSDADGASANGEVVPISNVTVGSWDGAAFTAGGSDVGVNAVKVTAFRTDANGNPINTLLLDAFGGLTSWDTGATAVAYQFVADCPNKEGIMAGGTLDLSSNNDFYGNLCLHGDEMVDMQNNNRFLANDEGEVPGVTYGVGGEICMGKGNCGTSSPYDFVVDHNPTVDGKILGAATWMPNVEKLYTGISDVLASPEQNTTDILLRRYYPDAIVSARDDAGIPTLITADSSSYVRRQTMSKSDFEALFPNDTGGGGGKGGKSGSDSDTGLARPLEEHTIYNVSCTGGEGNHGKGNTTLDLTGAVEVLNVVIVTDCRVSFSSNVVFSGSTLFTSYDNDSNAAVYGSAGTTIGTGSCEDPTGGSKIIAAGDIDFAAGLNVEHSQLISTGDIHIAAQADGMLGTSIIAGGDVSITSNGMWQGCPSGGAPANPFVPLSYRLVM